MSPLADMPPNAGQGSQHWGVYQFFPTSVGITMIQPGVSASIVSEDMLQLVGSTASYLQETYGIELKVVCRA